MRLAPLEWRAVPAWLVSLGVAVLFGREGEALERTVEVSCPSEAVIGFPIPLRFVVHGPAVVTSARLSSRANPFRFELRSRRATYVFPARRYHEVRPPRKLYLELQPEVVRVPLETVRIEEGESRELVLDLSLLEHKPGRGAGLVGGKYTFVFPEPDLFFRPAEKAIRLVEPNAEEKKLLKNLSAMGRGGQVWKAFVEQHDRAVAGVDARLFGEVARRQLGYHTLLAKLVNDRAPIGELPAPDDLSDFLPEYRNEIWILRYEIELAAGRTAASEQARAAILAERPGTEVLLDHVRERGGLIARHRKAAAQVRGGARPLR